MVTYTTTYVIATLAAVCLTTAWPQQRVPQPENNSKEDLDRIIMESDETAYLKTIFTYPNGRNTSASTENKSMQKRPLHLQGGFYLDKDSKQPQARRGDQPGRGLHVDDPDYTRRQRQHQPSQRQSPQASRRADTEVASGERGGRMDKVDEGRGRGNSRGNSSQQPRAHQAPNNQTRSGGSGRVDGTSTMTEGAQEGRGLLDTRTNVTSTRVKMPNESIVFPEASREQRRQFVPELQGDRPHCADDGDTFCTAPTGDYPIEHLSRILDQQGVVFRNFFTSDVVPEANDIAQRFDDGTLDEQPLCMSEAHVVYPKVAQNKDNEWMFIVNLNEDDYKQGVRVEKCRTPDEPCAYNEGFPSGRQTKCRQKYIYRQMLAVTQDGTPKPDSFKLPSCCACHTSISEAVARSGFDLSNQTPAPKRRRRRG